MNGGKESNEPADASRPCRRHGLARPLAIFALPEVDPFGAEHRCKVANLQHFHSASVHGQQTPVEVEHLNAVWAALDETCSEVLVPPQRFEWFGFSGSGTANLCIPFLLEPTKPENLGLNVERGEIR